MKKLVILVALLALLGACGGSSDSDRVAVRNSSGTNASPDTTATTMDADEFARLNQETSGPPVTSGSPTPSPSPGALSPTSTTPPLTKLPDDAFEVRFEGVNYLCQPARFSFGSNDCVRYSGGSAPSFFSPQLYCSGSFTHECSKLWYPDELDDFDLTTINGQTHLCKNALFGGSFGDKDCAPYRGGDPDRVSFVLALKCSPDPVYLRCDEDYYPSEMKGLTIVRIDGYQYVCKDTYSGQECHRWYGSGSPKSATYGSPDLYCNNSGVCAEDGYPSRY